MDEENNESARRLRGLQNMINTVYLPLLESKPDTKMNMEKFCRQISISLVQAYRTETIHVPQVPAGVAIEEILRNKALIDEYQNAIVSFNRRQL